MSAPGDHVQNPAHIFLGPPPGDWQVVMSALAHGTARGGNPQREKEALMALARLREREAQTAELYEQKIERIEELEREVKRQEDEKWAAENRADNAEARVAELERAQTIYDGAEIGLRRRVARLEEALRETVQWLSDYADADDWHAYVGKDGGRIDSYVDALLVRARRALAHEEEA